MKNILKKKAIKITIIIFLILLIGLVIVKNLSFKEFGLITVYDYYNNRNKTIELDVPLLSFSYQEGEQEIFLWNIRENKVLKKEMDLLLKDMEVIRCDGNEYYYDNKNNITIIDYQIKDYYLWNTIYYHYEFDNYCDRLEVEKANQLIDYGSTYSMELALDESSYIVMLSLKSDFQASFVIKKYNADRSNVIEYENSKGSFVLKNNKLIYTRSKKSGVGITIPEMSEFVIQDKHTLVLDEDYLKELFLSQVILESDTK